MNLPKISIITPSYNQEKFIEGTILSVLNQNYPNFEHIIIDGGSADNTIEILKKYPHLIWTSEPDKGQSDAINKGLKIATGEVIGWLNSDDSYEPNIFFTIGEIFANDTDLDMIYGDCNYIYEDNKGKKVVSKYKTPRFKLRKLLTCGYNYISQPSTFFRKRILNKIGLLDIKLSYAMDHDLFIRIGIINSKIKKINQVLSNFRKHINSKTMSQGLKMRKESFQISKKYGGDNLILRLNYFLAYIVYSNPFLIQFLRNIKYKYLKVLYG